MQRERRSIILMIGILMGSLAFCRAAPYVNSPELSSSGQGAVTKTCSASVVKKVLVHASRLLRNGNFERAAEVLRAKDVVNCDPRADLFLAAALEEVGNSSQAKRTIEKAHTIWPGNINIATSLARYDLQEGKFVAAEDAIRRCKPSQATPLRELQVIAMVYLENHDLSRAKSVAAMAFHAHPSEQTLLFAANVLQLQGLDVNAVVLLRKYRKNYGDSPPFLITIAESEYDGMMYDAARKDLLHAVALSPDSYPAHYLLGNLFVTTGKVKLGVVQYRKAIAISPHQPRTYYRLGRAFEKEGKNREAKKYFHESLQVDRHYAPAYCELGKLEFRSNELHQATRNLSLAIQYNPSIQESYYLLIQTYARLGERSKSQAVLSRWSAYKKAHRLRPAALNRKNPLSTQLGSR